MLGRLYAGQDCSAAKALELVGERWSLLILRDAMFRGHTRFSEFQNSLGLASNVLTTRLDGFVETGLMRRAEDGEYLLTEMGLETKAVVVALTLWGDRWLQPGPIAFINRSSGDDVTQAFIMNGCQVPPYEVGVKRRS